MKAASAGAGAGPTDKWNGRFSERLADLGVRGREISLNLGSDSAGMLVTIADGQFMSEK